MCNKNQLSLPKGYAISFKQPTVGQYLRLRADAGWDEVDAGLVRAGLDNSLFTVVLHKHQELIGMGRVVGDGALFFYIQDLIVDKNCQGQGLGALLMQHIENYLDMTARKGATIGLFAAKGKERFYTRFGYLPRSGDNLGLGMCKFV